MFELTYANVEQIAVEDAEQLAGDLTYCKGSYAWELFGYNSPSERLRYVEAFNRRMTELKNLS